MPTACLHVQNSLCQPDGTSAQKTGAHALCKYTDNGNLQVY